MYPSQGNRNVSTESRKSNIVRYDAYSRGLAHSNAILEMLQKVVQK